MQVWKASPKACKRVSIFWKIKSCLTVTHATSSQKKLPSKIKRITLSPLKSWSVGSKPFANVTQFNGFGHHAGQITISKRKEKAVTIKLPPFFLSCLAVTQYKRRQTKPCISFLVPLSAFRRCVWV